MSCLEDLEKLVALSLKRALNKLLVRWILLSGKVGDDFARDPKVTRGWCLLERRGHSLEHARCDFESAFLEERESTTNRNASLLGDHRIRAVLGEEKVEYRPSLRASRSTLWWDAIR